MHTGPATKQKNVKVSVEWSLEAALCLGMYDIMHHLL